MGVGRASGGRWAAKAWGVEGRRDEGEAQRPENEEALHLVYVCYLPTSCICGHIIQGYRFPFEQRSQAGSSLGSSIIREGVRRLDAA